jgi:RimJ/RimL family protein N-acetyltransferase
VRYIPWPVRTREQVRAALVAFGGSRRLVETGDSALFAICERDGERVVGQMNLSVTSREDRQGEFGYVVARSHAGRGYATEASACMLDHAFDAIGLHRVVARIDVRNVASAAVARKLGMRREAEFVESEWFKGEWSSVWIYAILVDEWFARCERRSNDAC